MNFTQLRAFHAVATEGSFTRGALRLGLSQPAVTVQVRALEQRYGLELFRRQGQRIELTGFGHELWRRKGLLAFIDRCNPVGVNVLLVQKRRYPRVRHAHVLVGGAFPV